MDYSLEMAIKYPLMKLRLTEEDDIMLIEGKMFVNNKDYSISLKQFTLIDGKQTYKLEKLQNINSPHTVQKIKDNLESNKFPNIVEVLDKIHDILEAQFPSESVENYCDIYRKVIHEYSEFTKFFLNLNACKLKEDLTGISASILDSKSRQHSVEITVDYQTKSANIFRITEFDLPPRDEDHFKSNESLVALFDQYIAQVELLQPYFDLMEEFDHNATILDPDKPKRRDCYRRIWLDNLKLKWNFNFHLFHFVLHKPVLQWQLYSTLVRPKLENASIGGFIAKILKIPVFQYPRAVSSDNISTIITVDPYNVFHRPDVKFLGPDRLIEPYSKHLNENLGNWIYQEHIFQGILDLLGLEQFPRKKITSNQVDLLVEYGECSICYSLRLNDKLPEIVCTNKSCENFYHKECLYDWLVCLNAKRVFNNISGNCPNCEKTISCPVLD